MSRMCCNAECKYYDGNTTLVCEDLDLQCE